MENFLKSIFVLGLFLIFPAFGETPENCSASKRGDHSMGRYASLQRCIKNGNCSTHHRRSTVKKRKTKTPQGELPPGSR